MLSLWQAEGEQPSQVEHIDREQQLIEYAAQCKTVDVHDSEA